MDNYPDLGLYSDLGFVDQTVADPLQTDLAGVFTDQTVVAPTTVDSTATSPLTTLLSLPQLLYALVTDVGGILQGAEKANPLDWLTALLALGGQINTLLVDGAQKVIDLETAASSVNAGDVGAGAKAAWDFISRWSGGFLYRGMLDVGLEVDTSQFDADAQNGINTVDTMLTFAFALQWIAGTIDSVGKGLFGGRWGEGISDALKKIPEELGLSWALGMSIDEAFKVAVGRSIEEGINRQKRGNRIEWQQLRAMLKQHAFDGLATDGMGHVTGSVSDVPSTPGLDVFTDLLKNQGFPDWQIDLLAKLNDVQIPVADISQLWYRNVIDDKTAKSLIGQLGFNTQQTTWLFNLYMDKAENTASVTYRSMARQMYVNYLITKDMYVGILKHANYPQRLIDDDLAAIALEQRVGKILQSVTVIKAQYQRGTHDADVARTELRQLNYSDSYITELLNTWDLPPLRKTHGLTQGKILSYWYSGVITDRTSALTQLMATGLTQDAASFLLDHPSASHAVTHARTPGLITQAYVDGAIAQTDLSSMYTKAGVTADALPQYMAIAQYRLAHRKGSAMPTQSPDTALYREAQKLGLIDFQTAVSRYEGLGWDADTAMLIAEIVNKGPYQKPTPPVFSTLQDALAYLESHGYTITPPADPMLQAAENMALESGYLYTKAGP